MLRPFFDWCDSTMLGQAIRGVTWAFPLIETIHILALAVLFGSIMFIDFRMLGLALRSLPVAKINRELAPYIGWSLAVILVTGVMLFLSEAAKAYDNAAFFPKVILLLMAIAYHFTIHARAARDESPDGPSWGKIAAIVSGVLWIGVGVAGRAIGFV